MFSAEQLSPTDSSADVSKGGSVRKRQQEAAGHQDSAHSVASTPDRYHS